MKKKDKYKPKYSIKYVYAGRHLNPEGTEVSSVFMRDGKTPAYFSAVFKRVYIGQTYLGSEKSMSAAPERVSEENKIVVDDKTFTKWNVQDDAAREFIRKTNEDRRIQKNLKEQSKSKRIKDLKKELAEITDGLSMREKELFLNALMLDLWTVKKKKAARK